MDRVRAAGGAVMDARRVPTALACRSVEPIAFSSDSR